MAESDDHVRPFLTRWEDPKAAYERGRMLGSVIDVDTHRSVIIDAGRPTVLDFFESSNEGRMPELIALRCGRMLVSPFAFFRGSAGLMAGDLSAGPSIGLNAQLCGDAHASNFGLYGTHDGRIVMDINDFDETASGPWEWDVKRLAASLVVAGRVAGASERECRDAAEDAVRAYRGTVQHLASLSFLESWTALGDDSVLDRVKAHDLLDDFAGAAKKARKNTSARASAKWTTTTAEGQKFVARPPILTEVGAATADSVMNGMTDYLRTLRDSRRHLLARFNIADIAFRIGGTGSVGLRNYLILLRGNGEETVILQAKQAQPSVISRYVDQPVISHEGERIVHGARLVQTETDLFLGWTTIDGLPFIVRQARNLSGEIDVTSLADDHLDDYGRLAGALLARAHSRSIDPRILAGYAGVSERMDGVIARYAVAYADQTEADHAALGQAVRDGRVPATDA